MTTSSPKVHIAVLIYNSGLYLDHCLDSLSKQSYSNLQVDLIYTESQDFSLTIINKYIKKYPELFVLHTTDFQSIAKSRSLALKLMNDGKYIIFVDGDDWVEPEFISCLVENAEAQDADVTCCSFITHRPKGNKISNIKYYPNLSDRLIHNTRYLSIVWNKLIKRSIIEKYKIDFNPDLSIGEDFDFMCKILLSTAKVIYIDQALYNYRTNTKSVTTKKNESQIESELHVTLEFEKLAKEKGLYEQLKDFIEYRKFEIKTNYLFALKEPDFEAFRKCCPEITTFSPYSTANFFRTLIFKQAIKGNDRIAKLGSKLRELIKNPLRILVRDQ